MNGFAVVAGHDAMFTLHHTNARKGWKLERRPPHDPSSQATAGADTGGSRDDLYHVGSWAEYVSTTGYSLRDTATYPLGAQGEVMIDHCIEIGVLCYFIGFAVGALLQAYFPLLNRKGWKP